MSWLLLLKNKWTWYGLIGVVIFVGSALMIHNYGVKRYNEGVMKERAAWQVVVQEAVTARDQANARIRVLQTQLDQQSETIRRERREDLRETQEAIRNAETVEDQFAIYRAHRERLRNEAAANLDRARADYLSTIGDGGTGSSAGIGPEPTPETDS